MNIDKKKKLIVQTDRNPCKVNKEMKGKKSGNVEEPAGGGYIRKSLTLIPTCTIVEHEENTLGSQSNIYDGWALTKANKVCANAAGTGPGKSWIEV